TAARAIEAFAAQTLGPQTLLERAGGAVARLAMALTPHARSTTEADEAPTDLVIDALLGSDLTLPVSGEMAQAIRWVQQQAAPVLAVDVPSGLPGDTGALAPGAPCVQARWTLALLTLAPGLFTAHGRDPSGEVWWDDLGVPTLPAGPPTPVAWLHSPVGTDAGGPVRRHGQHKGSFGDVWVLGGGRSMAGAALLAGRAALGVGAGRIYVHLLDPGAPRLDPQHPELMLADAPDALRLQAATAVIGCGGGPTLRDHLPGALHHAARLVLDADALNALAEAPALCNALRGRRERGLPTVLTPHPLEAARLLGCSAAEVQADRFHAVRTLASRLGAAVVLKGSGSLVVLPDAGAIAWINTSGNAALATPGSGDVLAGWIAGLWSQLAGGREGLDVAQRWSDAEWAARQAVYRHGLRAEQHSATGSVLVASRLIPDGH
uniref:NAD(P)H-hydrate dehydratase n=1 Tax=Sphaerotilus sp. TaxID=2093942 RepID=UPI0025CCA379